MVGNFGFDDGNIVLDVTGMLLDIFVCIYIYMYRYRYTHLN